MKKIKNNLLLWLLGFLGDFAKIKSVANSKTFHIKYNEDSSCQTNRKRRLAVGSKLIVKQKKVRSKKLSNKKLGVS